jgi:hypothetical protein
LSALSDQCGIGTSTLILRFDKSQIPNKAASPFRGGEKARQRLVGKDGEITL